MLVVEPSLANMTKCSKGTLASLVIGFESVIFERFNIGTYVCLCILVKERVGDRDIKSELITGCN